MSKFSIFFMVVALTSLTMSSAQESNALLYGTIGNSQSDSISLSNHYGQYFCTTDLNGHYRFDLNIQSPEFLNFHIDDDHFTFMILEGDTVEINFDKLDIQETIQIKENRNRTNNELVALSYGARAPEFSFKDPSGKTIGLKDFAGKYIYIDVWNSGCGPCFKEFPVMEDLIGKYSDRNIEFVGICLDQNEKRWRRTLEKRDLKGIQLFGEGWESEFVKDYHIWFNPRFILIDKDQRIVYLSAPRPTGNIIETFESLPGL